jgi:hypothetical protein
MSRNISPDSYISFQIDHIISIKHGGGDEKGNH